MTYQTPGLKAYTIQSGDRIEETFHGVCGGQPVPDAGTRVVTAAVEKYLVHVELQSHIDFRTGGCRGKYNDYKESFLVDVSDGACKFSYRQDRDLTGVGAFDNNLPDLACVVEILR